MFGESVIGIFPAPYTLLFKTNVTKHYVLGSNIQYQLGFAGNTGVTKITAAEFDIPGKRISSMYVGGIQPYLFALIITDGCDYPQGNPITVPNLTCNNANGVYGYGSNNVGQLGGKKYNMY